MRLCILHRHIVTTSALAAMTIVAPSAVGQSFNIDLDFPTAPPALGGGVPASTYGAASGQVGVWNSVFTTVGPQALLDLSGAVTTVDYSVPFSTFGVSMLASNNPGNTGDFGLLFNDGTQVGTVVQGGTNTYRFSGLMDGLYSIYTYSGSPGGGDNHTSVSIAGSNEGTLVSSGVYTPSTFTLGATHVIHTINLVGGVLNIDISDTPGSPPAWVNGFQIVLVPGPGTLAVMLAIVPMMRRRRCA